MSSHELPGEAVLELEAHQDLLVVVGLQHVLGLVGVDQPAGQDANTQLTSQHELTAYLTVPNHSMNSQPT